MHIEPIYLYGGLATFFVLVFGFTIYVDRSDCRKLIAAIGKLPKLSQWTAAETVKLGDLACHAHVLSALSPATRLRPLFQRSLKGSDLWVFRISRGRRDYVVGVVRHGLQLPEISIDFPDATLSAIARRNFRCLGAPMASDSQRASMKAVLPKHELQEGIIKILNGSSAARVYVDGSYLVVVCDSIYGYSVRPYSEFLRSIEKLAKKLASVKPPSS